MSISYRMRSAACIAALSTAFYATATWANPGGDTFENTATVDQYSAQASSTVGTPLKPEQLAMLESQRASYAGLPVEQLYPSWWRDPAKRPQYVDELVNKLQWDHAKLGRGELLGIFDGGNVHPFIESSGAIRIDVPLPDNAEEFEQLVQFILSENSRNEDRAQYDRSFFDRMAADGSGKIIGVNKELNGIYLKDMSFDTNPNKSPNLIRLMTSIIVQKADQDVYGKNARGRYGENTYNRLSYGNIGGNKRPEQHVYSGFIYNKATKLPVAALTASTNVTTDGKPTLFFHFAFRTKGADKQFVIAPTLQRILEAQGVKGVSAIQGLSAAIMGDAMSTAYSKPYDNPQDITLQGHTDKFRAVLQGMNMVQRNASFTDELRKEMAWDAFTKLWKDPSQEFYWVLNDNGKLPNAIVSVDGSTVPPGDLGTEYPEPNNEYYQELYRIWRNEILPTKGVAPKKLESVPQELRHGKISPDQLKEKLPVFWPFADDLFRILKTENFTANRFVYFDQKKSTMAGKVTTGAIFQADSGVHYVADNYPVNQFDGAPVYLEEGLRSYMRSYIRSNSGNMNPELEELLLGSGLIRSTM